MSFASAALQRNLSRMELALGVLVISVLAAVILQRYERVATLAERAAVDNLVAEYRARLRLFNMTELARRTRDEVVALAGSNPFALFGAPVARAGGLAVLPARSGMPEQGPAPGYVGEISSDRVPGLKKGSWAFDKDAGVLVYRTEHPQGFDGPGGAPQYLRFALRVDFVDADADGSFDPGKEQVRGLRLDRLPAAGHATDG